MFGLNKFANILKSRINFSLSCKQTKLVETCAKSSRIEPVNLSYAEFNPSNQSDCSLSPIIISDGLFGSKENWQSLAKSISLETKRKVYTLDARNHGESPHTEDHNYFLMAADLENFLISVNEKKAILLGHSMGGLAGMLLALTKPLLVETLIVVDVVPFPSSNKIMGPIPGYIGAMKALDNIPAGTSLKAAYEMIDQNLSKIINSFQFRAFLLKNLKETNNKLHWQFNISTLEKHLSSVLGFPKIDGPKPTISGQYTGRALFICGGNSKYVPPEMHPRVRIYFPKAQFLYIEGAGHWVYQDKPAEFLEIVAKYINENIK